MWWGLAVLGCLLVAGGLSLLASSSPDGLERVAQDSGFAEHAAERTGLLDYDSVGGVVGVVVVLLLMTGLAWLAARRRSARAATRAADARPRRDRADHTLTEIETENA